VGIPIWRQRANRAKMVQIGPKGPSRTLGGRAKNERNRTKTSQVMPILRFFRPGHPTNCPETLKTKRLYLVGAIRFSPILILEKLLLKI